MTSQRTDLADLAARIAAVEGELATLTARRDALASEVAALEERASKAQAATEREKTRAGLHKGELVDLCDRLDRALDRIGVTGGQAA